MLREYYRTRLQLNAHCFISIRGTWRESVILSSWSCQRNCKLRICAPFRSVGFRRLLSPTEEAVYQNTITKAPAVDTSFTDVAPKPPHHSTSWNLIDTLPVILMEWILKAFESLLESNKWERTARKGELEGGPQIKNLEKKNLRRKNMSSRRHVLRW